MMLPVLSELSELYRAADGAATACLLAKLGVEKCLMAKLEDTRQALLVRGQGCLGAIAGADQLWRPPWRLLPLCLLTLVALHCCATYSLFGVRHHNVLPQALGMGVLLCMQSKLSLTLKEYRLLHGAHVRNPGALIYPSTLRYMPAFLLGLVKTSAFR